MTTHKSIWQIARSVNELFFQNGLQQTNLLPRLPCETQPTIPNEAISPFLLRASVLLLTEVNRSFRDSWLQRVLGKSFSNVLRKYFFKYWPLLLHSLPPHIGTTSPSFNSVSDCVTNFKPKGGCFSGTFSLSCPLSDVKTKIDENLA